MSTHHSDLPDEPVDDLLEQAVRAMKLEPIPAGPSAEAITATLQTLEKREQTSNTTILSIPRSRFMRIAKAGSGLLLTSCVVLAIVALRAPTSAYAQVIENARKAKSMSYLTEIRTLGIDRPPAVVREYVAADGRSRTEHMFNGKPSGTVTIHDAAGFPRLLLSDPSALAPPGLAALPVMRRKTAMVRPAHEDKHPVEGGHKNSWLRSLQSLKDTPEKDLGQKELEGKTVRGFEATYGKTHFEMWVDVKTGSPVQIDYDSLVHHVTMTEFQFNQQLDESLFSFDPPEGYEVRQPATTPKVAGGEESLIAALRSFTEKSGGAFPASITDWGEWVTLLFNDVFKGALKKGAVDDNTQGELNATMANLGAVTPFLFAMDKADYRYRGKGKTTADKDAVVFWYKKPNGVYRAIMGDLTVKDIAAAEVPKD
ncbi:hypothetical protein Pan44_24610 [Caulifigura coniformis]|uniref:DUF2092 domain-containing protein n=1 Tax=Caulifigura coniformis TaxID=2527983 RepID=A0A517SE92_9PLAN|nr:hypothetical protein [Caulifigura coniformis]QDT54428.1 hypothetical protein Pan44_24610 [Caulifigura coniformis]